MAVNSRELKIIQDAITRKSMIGFRYQPNTNPPGDVSGIRYAVPIELFKKNNKYYLFAYFVFGASLSQAGTGWRLYLQKNIYDVFTLDNKQFSVQKSKLTNWSNIKFKMLLQNDVE